MKKLKEMKKVDLFAYGLLAILAILFIVLCVQLVRSVVPFKYLIILIILMLVLWGIILLLAKQKHKVFKTFSIIFSVCFIAISTFGVVYVQKTLDIVGNITDANKTRIEYDVVVMNDLVTTKIDKDVQEGPLTDMEPYANLSYGIVELGDTTHNSEVVDRLRSDLDSQVDVARYNTIKDAQTALSEGEVEGLIINANLKDMFEEEYLTNNTQIIAKYFYEKERDNSKNNSVNVTKEPFLVYISGIDTYGAISTQSRSDVNKVMAINPSSHEILLIDIPRDYYVSQTCQGGAYDKLTHTGVFGVDCTVDTMSQFLDVDINYYIRVNFSSLVDIVDALGGVEVESDFTFSAGGYYFTAGTNYLNGDEALAFSRERYSFADGDNQRIKNQTKVIEGIIKKAMSPAIITNYMDFMNVIGNCVETNLSDSEIYALVKKQVSDMSGWSINSYALNGYGSSIYSPLNGFDSYMMVPNDDSVLEAKSLLDNLMNSY